MSKTRITKEEANNKIINDKTNWNEILGKPQDKVDFEALSDKENPVLKEPKFNRLKPGKRD